MGDHRAGKQTRPLARAIRGAEKMALGRTAAGRIAIMAVEPPKFKVSREISREDIFFSLARVAGSERVFLGSSNGSVYALDCAGKLDPVAMPGHTSYVTGLALAGEQLVSGSYDGQLIWWNAATRETTRKIKGHDRWIRDVKSSPDGKLIASVGDDMVCRLWDAETAKLKHELRGHEPMTPTQFTSMLYTCAFSADGHLLPTSDRVGHIVVWDVTEASRLRLSKHRSFTPGTASSAFRPSAAYRLSPFPPTPNLF